MNVRIVLLSLALLAVTGATHVRAGQSSDALPVTAAGYGTSDAAAREPMARLARDLDPAYAFEPEPVAAEAPSTQQSYWPLLWSALVPGAGEISMGYYKRGAFLVLAEVVAWTGYATYHDDGLDKRTEYEAFADAHWDEQKWIDDHPCSSLPPGDRTLEDLEACGEASSGSGAWPGYIPYVPKSEDKQHYYENLGKYDWYISGWQDWNPSDIPYAMDTPLRDQYRSMREESNDALDDANAFIWVSVAARAFSLAETAILINQRRKAAGGSGQGSVSLSARPRGWDGGELALEVRFK